ncbi:MAG: tetratricopeptide repeat protein [Candidatus Eisenbacteria bacterium]
MLAALEARLRGLRDDARARVAARAAALAAQADALALWGAAMERLHVAGPDSAYWAAAPVGATSATAALAAERALAAHLRASADSIAARTPRVFDRSLEDAWRPALAARITAQAREGARDRAWAAALGRTLDSARVAATSGPEWDAAKRTATVAEQRAAAAETREREVRGRIARDASARTLAALEGEREGLDYLRAISAYALAVQLDEGDTTQAPVAAARPAADDTDTGDPALRAAALPLLRAFVTRHPDSPARAEMRFRLADLELLEARRTFRARMSEFLRAQEAGGRVPPVPVLEPGAALALYRAMLAEDATVPHLDAVRFNTAMILAEAGSPESAEHFRALLERWPGSPYAQEAALRLGDLAFADRRWSDAAPLFDRAAAGADPTLATIALYKRGWAAYNEDRFAEAARAFAGVLDQYETRGAAVHVDVASEAESYFVIALAASGGADAWTRHFAASGPRAYRHRTLLALGAQLRRNGDLAGAAAADALLIEREPLHADALFAAERRVETLRRAGDPAALEAAQGALATRFADGGAWAGAQESDSLRAAGERFTTGVAGALARTRHERARRTNAPADWQLALAADEAAAARAVNEPERAARRLDVARARLALGDRAGAVRECERVASNAPDTLAREALALAVMTTDAWYESARAGAARGSDSLAAAVTRAGDRLLERFPADPLRADVRWRQAQLALAHGDDARALTALDALLARDGADVRAPRAAMQRGEASARLGRWDDADSAFARATRLARGAKQEPLARQAFAAQQACVFRAAEAEVARDSNAYARHARAFEKAAARWPAHEDADAARYRAALAWERAGEPRDAARVLTAFTADRPRAELARDAWLLLARQHETLRDSAAAAHAFLACAALERDDVQASAARLRPADDFEAAGQVARADSLRREHVRRHPGDLEGAMAIYERLALRELDAVTETRPVSALIASGATRGVAAAPRSALAEYLRLARLRPALVSPMLVGRLRWLQGEDARLAAARVTLAPPLAKPLTARRALLDSAVVRYRRAMDSGSPVWAHAAAWRIGETLQDFAAALAASAAPADLAGDDLEEYRAVLAEKARPFAARGLDVWAELARTGDAGQAPDAWVARAREQVERHLAERFRFRPEPVFPAVEGGVSWTSREGVSR